MDYPHCRLNPLLDKWVLVSPHRLKRPWQGAEESPEKTASVPSDYKNPLSPGSIRPNGQINPVYDSTYAFTNDFPALLEDTEEAVKSDDPLFQNMTAKGTCRVLCFHPDSNITIPLMKINEIENVIQLWIDEFQALSLKYSWIQIFENRGEIMGCSNPHPHCQIWASSFYPSYPHLECMNQKDFKMKYGKNMLLTYLEKELLKKERLVVEGQHWVCLVPYWAEWPFETMLLPKRHILRLSDMTPEEKIDLAKVIKILTCKYDNLFQCSFPYSMGWLGAPTGPYLQSDQSHWLLHAIYLPPLLRSATVKKFCVGYEMICQPQRDLTPEIAALKLRELPDKHYSCP